jgi:ubiquinol-cytochrome c reductase cytochrome b subunit
LPSRSAYAPACKKKDQEIALHGFESGRPCDSGGFEYIEVHEQLDDYERWRLVSFMNTHR